MDQRGQIRLAGFAYAVGPVFAGEHVEVVAAEGIVSILHNGCWSCPTRNDCGLTNSTASSARSGPRWCGVRGR